MGQIIDTRIVNALFAEARMSADVAEAVGEIGGELGGVGGAVAKDSLVSTMAAFREAYGGLWVGGKAVLSDVALRFDANALNRLVHENGEDLRIEIPLSAIEAVTTRFGWFTGIVDVRSAGTLFTLRCYGSKSFAQKIAAAAGIVVTAE